MNSELSYWLAFTKIPNIGPVRFQKIRKHFNSLEEAWHAPHGDFITAGIPSNIAQEITLRRSEVNPDSLIAELVQNKVLAVTLEDEAYPKLLKEIPDAPPVLYYKGDLGDDELLLSVVGTRKMSPYGKQVVETLVPSAIRAGATIVSGLALGVDAHAHTTCLTRNGRTIAVLASGLDTNSIYPSHNRFIAKKIISEGGLLVSERPIGATPLKTHFPQRNRIIAGLSQATLVIEAAQKSGANITAYQALEYNRSVGAVPGSMFSPLSTGCHALLQKGAAVVSSADDVLSLLGISDHSMKDKAIPRDLLTEQEEALYAFISFEPTSFDSIVQKTGLDAASTARLITHLEMKGYITDTGGRQYVKIV
ncbi:MAG: DNA-processing protein DprA [Patescibacteria group bacterium]